MAEGSGILFGGDRALVDALVAISSDLNLDSVLDRLVRAACELTDAQYGALGVLGEPNRVTRLITHGLTADELVALGPEPPSGHGLVGVLIDDPRPLRLARLRDHPASVGFPPHHPEMTTFLGVPVRVRGTVFGNLYLCDKADGAKFSEEDEGLVEVLATAAAHVIENAHAYAQSERHRLWLEASALVADLLQPPAQVEEALRQVTVSARRITGARAAALLQQRSGQLEVGVCDGATHDRLCETIAALGDRAVRAGEGTDVVTEMLGGEQVLLAPLREQLTRGGLLAVVGPDPAAPDSAQLLASFADQAALALDRAQALADREELLLTADRERIARDLHDLVIQRLFATGLQLQGARRRAQRPDVLERLEEAIGSLDVTIRDIRSTIFDLQHSHEERSLQAQVRRVAREYAGVLSHDPVVRTDGPLDSVTPPHVGEQLVTVLREALSNVARHARAQHTWIDVHAGEGELRLVVTDDGVGLPAERRESGMRNVRRRAADLGGTVRISAPDEGPGTRLEWRVRTAPPG
ncbi:MAG TPA: GAF domain-containing protein [Nocardioidaceae bacterium]|nr:GAF domain-containing protein [Nocardioidaceae bacterium]